MTEDTQFGRDLIEGLEEALAIVKGEKDAARVHLPKDWPDVKVIRTKLGLSREAFADRFGLKTAAVRDWEQGLRRPDPAARTLLKVIEKNPKAVEEALKAA